MFFDLFFILILLIIPVNPSIYNDFFNSLRSIDEILDFVQLPYKWAGDVVVESEDGKKIVMHNKKNGFELKHCLDALTDLRRSTQTVILDIDSPNVLRRMNKLLTKRHGFIILLFRFLVGPNRETTNFGSFEKFEELIRETRIVKEVKFGIGYNVTNYGVVRSYNHSHFTALDRAMTSPVLAKRTILVDFDIFQLSCTNIDLIGNQVFSFEIVLLRSEDDFVEQMVDINQVRMLVILGGSRRVLFAVGDNLRRSIVVPHNGPAERSSQVSVVVLIIMLILIWK